ncbi:hypothetical protein NUKP42_46350 [Klebsiella variicola]|nr:hypothetical protein NUKP42_46350 [Klebsiella variicola]GKN59864.1 hypothetical protein NUKP86_12550 [Klebsiella variicola]
MNEFSFYASHEKHFPFSVQKSDDLADLSQDPLEPVFPVTPFFSSALEISALKQHSTLWDNRLPTVKKVIPFGC